MKNCPNCGSQRLAFTTKETAGVMNVRWAMKGLRKVHAEMFEPDVNDQMEDALSVEDGEVKSAQAMPSKEPPQSLGSSEKPEEEEFKQDVPTNHQVPALDQPGTKGTPTDLKARKAQDESADEELAEDVENVVNKHMQENAPEELAEGHKPWASKVSRSRVEDLILEGKTVQAAGYAIRIGSKGGKDQVEVVGQGIPPMAFPLRKMTAGIEFFAGLVETAGMDPGKVNEQQSDAVKPPAAKHPLDADSSSEDVKSMEPGAIKGDGKGYSQPGTAKPSPDMPSNDGEGFKSPALRAPQPANPKQPGTKMPDTNLGQHSSDGEGFETPKLEPSSKKASRNDIRNALKGGSSR